MGGYFSTRWNYERTRPHTGAQLKLDAAILRKMGALAPGAIASHQWTDGRGDAVGSIQSVMSTDSDAPSLTLMYRMREQDGEWLDIRERLWLEATPCNYGSERLWLTCPGCHSRRRVLYGLGGRFRCRQCHNLAYTSTRDDAHDRSVRRIRKLQARLGAPAAGLFDLPPRPRGMHWDTYERIARELHHENQLRMRMLIAQREKLMESLDRLEQ